MAERWRQSKVSEISRVGYISVQQAEVHVYRPSRLRRCPLYFRRVVLLCKHFVWSLKDIFGNCFFLLLFLVVRCRLLQHVTVASC